MSRIMYAYLGRVILILFVLANTGFTSVMHTCSMSGMDCCGENSSDMHCRQEASHRGQSPVIVASDCMSSVTLGGLPDTHAVGMKSYNPTKQLVVDITSALYSVAINPDVKSSAQHIAQDASSPPSETRKYLVNLILLI